MRLIALFAVVVVLSATGFPHVLQKIERELKAMQSAYHSGDHSQAFSRLMVVKLELDELHKEFEIEDNRAPSAPADCGDLLKQLVTHAASSNWLQNFQQFEELLDQLSQSCTNADFPLDSSLQTVEGFNDHCSICVVILRIMQNYVSYYRKDVTSFVSREFCQLFNGTLKPTCEAFVTSAGPIVINSLVTKEPADRACLRMGMCKNPNCTITSESMRVLGEANIGTLQKNPSWTWLVHLFTKHFGDQHFPPFDFDNDTFSDVSTFRGYHWRGADCDELNAKIYPGRKTGNKMLDHDCNGIFGKAETGHLYEDLWCSKSKRFGVAVLGDSAGAHFSIPERYMNVTLMKKGVYHDFLSRAADELDLPHESAYTAHTQTNYLSHSVYKYIREWNLCNNNDYQNTGVNGARSTNCETNFKALVRDAKEDHPMLVFMELIGNDVCSSDMGMTTVPEFRKNIKKLLGQLDDRLPSGSLLIAFGLADGQILYDNLHDDKHPLNITYSTLYDFLNCLKISPCFGWLNSNATYREMTTQRAKELSAVYQEIIDSTTFKNMKVVYYDYPTMDILERRIIEGGDPKLMIEKCDGFHPSGLFNSYLADWIWAKLRTDHREWLGEPNPYNADIRKKFNMTIFKDPLHPESQ